MQDVKEGAAGMDQWAPADFKLLSDRAYGELARMLNMVENGSSWPESLQMARAAFMEKDPEDGQNPLAYRVLLMLPTTYRMWTRTRLRRFLPWIAEWALDEMYAGVEGQRAADAAYSTALEIEDCLLTNTPFHRGGSGHI